MSIKIDIKINTILTNKSLEKNGVKQNKLILEILSSIFYPDLHWKTNKP
jgi:hypothetical protein